MLSIGNGPFFDKAAKKHETLVTILRISTKNLFYFAEEDMRYIAINTNGRVSRNVSQNG